MDFLWVLFFSSPSCFRLTMIFLNQIRGDQFETTLVGFGLLIVVVLLTYLIRRSKSRCKLFIILMLIVLLWILVDENANRFRKRDKVLHYGRRFLRTVKKIISLLNSFIIILDAILFINSSKSNSTSSEKVTEDWEIP
jgi:hypothetical protein